MADDQYPSASDETNTHVERLAGILRENHQALEGAQDIGVSLEIPLGVRQRLIDFYGDEARKWLDGVNVVTSDGRTI